MKLKLQKVRYLKRTFIFGVEVPIERVGFRAVFEPDPAQEDFAVGMSFHIVSVNRVTGEVCFSLDHDWCPPND